MEEFTLVSVTFAKTRTPSNYVTKKLENQITIQGVFRNPGDIVNPVIIVEAGSDMHKLLQANYAVISEFNREYFVTKCVVESNTLIKFQLHCDVLSSYWNEGLRFSRCIAGRSSSSFQSDLVDDQMWFTADSLYSVRDFPNSPFSGNPSRRFVITLAGVDE